MSNTSAGSSPTPQPKPSTLQTQIWRSTIPLHITCPLSSNPDQPYLVSAPRLSYLPLLLPQLQAFFGISENSADDQVTTTTAFTYEGIVLRNLPIGLLFDLYAGPAGGSSGSAGGEQQQEQQWQVQVPWRLMLEEGPAWDIRDTFVNSVKEADFLRNGTARGIMSLSREDSDELWNAVKDSDIKAYLPIQTKLLSSAQPLRHIPLRIYIPSPPPSKTSSNNKNTELNPLGAFKVVQALIQPRIPGTRESQTLGTALNSLLPHLFPSRRDAILAEPIMHGSPVPFRAPLEELMREACFADGWVGVCVVMLG